MTKRQQKIIGVIRKHVENHGYVPSVRKLSRLVGVCEKTMRKHVESMVEQGVIDSGPDKYGGAYSVTEKGRKTYCRMQVSG